MTMSVQEASYRSVLFTLSSRCAILSLQHSIWSRDLAVCRYQVSKKRDSNRKRSLFVPATHSLGLGTYVAISLPRTDRINRLRG